MPEAVKCLVAVIAYNEGQNIAATLQDLQDHDHGYDVVVIDNGSSDDTAQIARRMGVPVISHCINSGGSAGTLMTYMLYACLNDYDVLCQFDGDGQHNAAELPRIVEPVASGEADYVIGSRFLEKEGFQSHALRRVGIRLFSVLDSLIVGQQITDVTSGFRAYGRKVFEFFARQYRHEVSDTSQLLLLSHFAGARIKEVPVTMKAREHGESEYGFFTAAAFPIKGLISVAGTLLQRSEIRKVR